jgi:hypothetical protein
MSPTVVSQPTLRLHSDLSHDGPGSVSVRRLGPDLFASLAGCSRLDDLLKPVFRVRVAEGPSPEGDSLPDVSGHYVLCHDEVRFVPTFPLENDVKYRAMFDPRPLGSQVTDEPLALEFLIPSVAMASPPTEVIHIFPSSDLLPENLLRFYLCFSSSMQRGRALEQISVLDSTGQPVADALYRPPVELWDRSMRRLTVLLDPGRLKRWVGPNLELGPPLRAGEKYTLQIGAGMEDLSGRPLREPFRKHFHVGDAVREPIAVEDWKVLPAVSNNREALALIFPRPLDWALAVQMITIGRADGAIVNGRVALDQGERRWSFVPDSPWTAGAYHVRVGPGLEDVCGNSITGAFDRPLRKAPEPARQIDGASLTFEVQ